MKAREAFGRLAPWWWIALLIAAIAFPFVERRIYYHVLAFNVLVAAANATSWNILGGYTGYISLGHSAFFGLGAYLVAITHVRLGWDPLWSAPVLALVVLVVALGLGWVVLRASGSTFVIATIAMLLIFRLGILNLGDLTGGATGLSQPLPPFTGDFVFLPLYMYVLGCLVLALLASAFIRRSRFGLGLLAIREDEGKAESVGIRTTAYKVAAFGVSAYFVALVGGIWGYRLIHISPAHSFDILVSVDMVLMSMLGGIGTLWGPVLGALIMVPAADYIRLTFGATQIHTTLLGVVLLVIVVFMPRGVVPTLRDLVRRRPGTRSAFAGARSAAERMGAGPATSGDPPLPGGKP